MELSSGLGVLAFPQCSMPPPPGACTPPGCVTGRFYWHPGFGMGTYPTACSVPSPLTSELGKSKVLCDYAPTPVLSLPGLGE